MRLCPSVEGSASPLITHRIGADVCMARQRTFFHKCHRCIYRGQAADWKPDESQQVLIAMNVAEAPARVGIVEVDLVNGRAKKAGKGKGKAAAADKAGVDKSARPAEAQA